MVAKRKTKIKLLLRREILPGDRSGNWLLEQQKFVGTGWRLFADKIEGQLKEVFGAAFFHKRGKGVWEVSGEDSAQSELAELSWRLKQALGDGLDLVIPLRISELVDERVWEKKAERDAPASPLDERIAALKEVIEQNKKDLAVLKRAKELLQ